MLEANEMEPRLLKKAAVAKLGRILSIVKTWIQNLEEVKVSIVYGLLQLLS